VMFTVTLNSMSGIIHKDWIVPIIFSMIFCNGIARAFYGPATFTVYAHSIPKEVYPNGSTWSSSSWQVASIVGPAAGGLIYGYAGKIMPGLSGITATFSVIIFFLLISLVLVFFLRKYPPVFVPKESIWKSLSEGIHFVFHNKSRGRRFGYYARHGIIGRGAYYAGHDAVFSYGQALAQPADSGYRLWFKYYLLWLVAQFLSVAFLHIY